MELNEPLVRCINYVAFFFFFSKRPWDLLPVNLNISYVQDEVNV